MVDIIVITYNDEDYIGLCLDRIKRNTPKGTYTLTVIDNGSSDLSSHWADIINKENIGPGPARNQGARLGTGEFICFVDSDILVQQGWLESMLKPFESPDTGLVGPQLYNECGAFYGVSPGFVPTACAMTRRSIYEEIGGFDDNMFFYEDTDYCMNIHKRELKIRMADTRMIHFGGLSFETPEELKEKIEIDRQYFNNKWNVNLKSFVETQKERNLNG